MGGQQERRTESSSARRRRWPVVSAARERLSTRLNDPSRAAPRVFRGAITRLHRMLPRVLRERVPVTFIGYALINGSAFCLDVTILWLLFDHLHWLYPLAVTCSYAVAGVYSLLLNRWLNFQARGHFAAQGSRYAVGLVSQYVIFILGLSSLLHWMGVNAEVARFMSACCEGLYLYVLMRVWVFRGTPEPAEVEEQRPDESVAANAA